MAKSFTLRNLKPAPKGIRPTKLPIVATPVAVPVPVTESIREERKMSLDENTSTPDPTVLDLGILDISDVPIPTEEVLAQPVEDALKADPAFKFCFIGSGQGGGRIAQQFYKYGYRRVCAINTAEADLVPLELPAENKRKMSGGASRDGAGGDPEVGKKLKQLAQASIG